MTNTHIEITDKLHLLCLLIGAIYRFVIGVVLAFLSGRPVVSSGSTRLVRYLFDNATVDQLQRVLPTTEQNYRHEASTRGRQLSEIVLPSGGSGLWLGPSSASRVLIYFHGGGYVCPASRSHLRFLMAIQNDLDRSKLDMSILMLSYQLAPSAVYPQQLIQGASLLTHVIKQQKIVPSKIVLGGDSAGGNMTMGLLSHLMHPHPAIPAVNLPEPLLGVFLISPWISFDLHTISDEQSKLDMLSARSLNKAQDAFLARPTDRDNYNEPLRAHTAWWRPISTVVDQIFVWYGEDEVLHNSIQQMAANLGQHTEIDVVRAIRQTHIGMIMDFSIGFTAPQTAEPLASWLRKALSQ